MSDDIICILECGGEKGKKLSFISKHKFLPFVQPFLNNILYTRQASQCKSFLSVILNFRTSLRKVFLLLINTFGTCH
jgi:hypothetical protein